jgi:hypothetical protein
MPCRTTIFSGDQFLNATRRTESRPRSLASSARFRCEDFGSACNCMAGMSRTDGTIRADFHLLNITWTKLHIAADDFIRQ